GVAKSGAANVVKHADDLPLDRIARRRARSHFTHHDSLTNGIHAAEESADKKFVDDGDAHAGLGVMLVKRAAFDHSDSERVDVARCHRLKRSALTFRRIRRRTAGDDESRAHPGSPARGPGNARAFL